MLCSEICRQRVLSANWARIEARLINEFKKLYSRVCTWTSAFCTNRKATNRKLNYAIEPIDVDVSHCQWFCDFSFQSTREPSQRLCLRWLLNWSVTLQFRSSFNRWSKRATAPSEGRTKLNSFYLVSRVPKAIQPSGRESNYGEVIIDSARSNFFLLLPRNYQAVEVNVMESF